MKRFEQCYLEIVSPVHVGCDEVYEPTGFVVDEATGCLVVLDPRDFFAAMNEKDRKRFSDICRKGTIASLLEVYKFLRGRRASGKPVGLCNGFLDHYAKTLTLSPGNERRIQQELNQFTISRTSFLTHDQRPYIPGSSIKGAIRTAYLNALAKKRSVDTPQYRGGHKDLEKTLLDGGSFATDPFRMVKVSDFLPVGDIPTKIVYAVNEKKKLSSFAPHGAYQILEVIEAGARFQGSITVDHPERGAKIRTPITMDTLLDSIRSFYAGEKHREDRELAHIGVDTPPLSPDGALGLLRVGRHSGAESVTIEGHRRIRIMQGKGNPAITLDHATTLWLASEHRNPRDKHGLQPLGWALVHALSDDRMREFQEAESRWMDDPAPRRAADVMPGSTKGTRQTPAPPKAVETEIWEAATLAWNAGRSELEASFGAKKATARGKDLVPESLHGKLFSKKKNVTARVAVEVAGPQYFKIVKIEPGS